MGICGPCRFVITKLKKNFLTGIWVKRVSIRISGVCRSCVKSAIDVSIID
jgi:hypothetical protein